jgi:hypoxanthine-DNA glycosylase
MPGPESLRKKEYYGYVHNQFWKIMTELFLPAEKRNEALLSYSKKVALLKKNKIALWDTVESCERVGAGDSEIKRLSPTDIEQLLKKFLQIEAIFFDGKLAEKIFLKYFPHLKIPNYYLPSTSPAHAGMPYKEKLKKWHHILVSLRGRRSRTKQS